MENNIVWEWEDAVKFIMDRCDLSREVIETVLNLEFGYEDSIGLFEGSCETMTET